MGEAMTGLRGIEAEGVGDSIVTEEVAPHPV